MNRFTMAFFITLLTSMGVQADVTLNGLFGDHMVLQRDIPVAVFGKAEPGETITIEFAGQSKSAVASRDGQWLIKLDPLQVSTNPATMSVSGKNKLTIKDIVVGDVWVCSGQSNMEWDLNSCNRREDIDSANFPLLRQFHVPGRVASSPVTDTRSGWNVCKPQTAGGFTAVGFYFGRKLLKETGVPIGLFKSAWGGTAIEPWTTPAGLASIKELNKDKDNLDRQIKEYRERLKAMVPQIQVYLEESEKAAADQKELPSPPDLPVYPVSSTYPSGWHCLYNGMIHPLIRYGIKGAIWYQGESNGGEGDSYFHKKQALIGGWRKAWNQGDFPFYFVQLANFQNPNDNPDGGDIGWAKTRQGQTRSLAIPSTGMAVAIDLADVGNPGDIHPKNKKDVGERLALWALAKDYGKKDIVYSGPIFKEMKIEGDKARILFDHVGSGLTVAIKKGYDNMVKDPGGKLKRFAIAGEDKKWVWADAVIDGKTVVVSSPQVPKPVAVRYAFSINPDGCNLYNEEGLPASPFRTDDW